MGSAGAKPDCLSVGNIPKRKERKNRASALRLHYCKTAELVKHTDCKWASPVNRRPVAKKKKLMPTSTKKKLRSTRTKKNPPATVLEYNICTRVLIPSFFKKFCAAIQIRPNYTLHGTKLTGSMYQCRQYHGIPW